MAPIKELAIAICVIAAIIAVAIYNSTGDDEPDDQWTLTMNGLTYKCTRTDDKVDCK